MKGHLAPETPETSAVATKAKVSTEASVATENEASVAREKNEASTATEAIAANPAHYLLFLHLMQLRLETQYFAHFLADGIETVNDLCILDDEDFERLRVKPLHRRKILASVAHLKEQTPPPPLEWGPPVFALPLYSPQKSKTVK